MILIVLSTFLIIPVPPAWSDNIPGFNQISTNPYIVDDLPISINADNAVNAREQAFEQALQTGFTIVIERLYPDAENRAGIKTPATAELGRMLQDFSTRDEQVGPKQYAATFQLRFRAGRVQKYLQSAGTPGKQAVPMGADTNASDQALHTPPSVQASSPSAALVPVAPIIKSSAPISVSTPVLTISSRVLVLPFFQTAQGQVLWAGPNPLRDALFANIQTHSALAVLPLGDLDDRQILNETFGIRANPASLQTLMAKYQADRMLMIVAVPDTLNPTTNATKMTLMFYGSSAMNPTPDYLDSVVASISDATDTDKSHDSSSLFTRAADNIQSQIPTLTSRINMEAPEQDILTEASSTLTPPTLPPTPSVSNVSIDTPVHQDSINAVLAQTMEPSGITAPLTSMDMRNTQPPNLPLQITDNGIPMIVRFNTMTEWNDIRTRIKSIPGVMTIRITKLKAQEATINIVTSPTITANPATLQAALNARGLQLHTDGSAIPGVSSPLILTRGIVPAAAEATDSVQIFNDFSYDFNTSSRPINASRSTIDGR